MMAGDGGDTRQKVLEVSNHSISSLIVPYSYVRPPLASRHVAAVTLSNSAKASQCFGPASRDE